MASRDDGRSDVIHVANHDVANTAAQPSRPQPDHLDLDDTDNNTIVLHDHGSWNDRRAGAEVHPTQDDTGAATGDDRANDAPVTPLKPEPEPAPSLAPHEDTFQQGTLFKDQWTTQWISPRGSQLKMAKPLLVIADLLVVAIAMTLAFQLRKAIPESAIVEPRVSFRDHRMLGLIGLPVWLTFLSYNKLYNARAVTRRIEEYRRIVRAVLMSVAGIATLSFAVNIEISRVWIALVAVVASMLLAVEREIARSIFDGLRKRGKGLRPVVIVGLNAEGIEVNRMLGNPLYGYEVVGFVDDGDHDDHGERNVLGTVRQTIDAVRQTGATGAVIATTALDLHDVNLLVRQLTDAGVHVEMSAALRDIATQRVQVRPLGRFPVLYIEPVRRHGWRSLAKRSFDIAGAAAGLAILSPVLVLIVAAIKLTSPGPVLFRQTRVGRYGEPFQILKFRSMVVNAEQLLIDLREQNEADGPLFKMEKDPRITKVGRFIRAASLDEVPQLWNVLRGEMSLVGPRPALPSEVEHWGDHLHGRLRVQPGITGMWQVSGRSNSSFEDYERLDLYYVDNWSLLADLFIMLKTIPVVLFRKGAY